jgi:peptide/nickel transport system substrate-binding protein
MKRQLAVLLAAACLAAGVASAKTFRYADQGDVLSMDPYMFNEALLLNFDGNMYESLVGLNKKLELEPGLATEWKQTSPTVWRFKLRPNVKFHDGSPFTADDVLFSLERARSASSDMKTYVAAIKEIKKVDALTIDIVTTAPFPILPRNIAFWYVMPKAWCEKNGATQPVDVRKGTENYASTHENGTGPFMLKSREPGVRTVLVPNPSWWGKAEHNVTEAIFTPVANAATRVAALISGEIDMMEPVPLQDIPRIEGSAELKVVHGMEARTIFLGMDQKRDELLFSNVKGKNPFKDKRVRQAFYQAIDIEAIKSRIMRNTSTPTGEMIAPMINGFVPELNKRLPYDPDKAKKLLAEAGYGSGFEVGMNCPNDRYVNDAEICQAVATMLARIGIKVNLMAETKAIFFPKVLRRDTSFYMLGWTPSSLDAHNALFALMATPADNGQGQFNLGAYSNPKVDELTAKIASENDQAKRQAMIAEAFKIHADDVGHLPLHQQPIVWGMKKGIDVVPLANNFNYLKWVTIK